MAITVKHSKVSTIPDDADTSLVRPSDWNADHTLVGLGTMAEQNASSVAITGGTVSNSTLTSDTVSNNLQFTSTTAPSYSQGLVWYDSTEKALAFYNDSSSLAVHVSQDLIFKVINNTGSTIANGSPVYITGTSSGQTYPNVALAKADVAATSAVIGLTNGAIANGATGYVSAQGTIDNVNTSTFTVGQVLYLSPYSAGQLMNTIPPTGITVQVGIATYIDSSAGHIYVKQTTPLSVPASIISGTLGVTQGGTGQNSALVAGSVVYGASTTAMGVTAAGTSGQVLTSAGAATPTWTTPLPMTYPSGTGIAVVTSGTSWGTTLTAPSGAIVGTTDTQTLTNKRINLRILSQTSTATLAINSDSYDQAVLTAQAAALAISAPTGTPVNGQKLTIRIKDNGTARALTWTTTSGGFRVIGTTLPTTTVASKVVYIGAIYNSDETFWDVVSTSQQA